VSPAGFTRSGYYAWLKNLFQAERKTTRGCFASFARRSLQATTFMGRLESFSIFEKLGQRAASIALRVSCELTA